ncbi:MAG: RNA pseudouridine synthase, partial [Odoribacteraceae bacterium]|nr:RNA pseudouridine synthase [Odoribacteraceae bacterium]
MNDPRQPTRDDDDLEDEEEPRHEHFRVEADPGQSPLRVDKFLADRLPNATRSRVQDAANAGCIHANGAPVKPNYRVKPGDIITLVLDRPKRDITIIPQNIPLDIIHEDPHLLVINK